MSGSVRQIRDVRNADSEGLHRLWPRVRTPTYTEWFAAEKRDKLRAMFKGYRAAGFGAEEAKNEIIKAVAKFGVDLSGEDWHNLLYRKKL